MTDCIDYQALLFRLAEGEAAPDEALRAARHLSDCTACRIVLAREERLAEMLDRIGDELPVTESFLASVMSAIPRRRRPAPVRSSPRLRRGMKLAGWLGAAALGGEAAWHAVRAMGAMRLVPDLPRPVPADLSAWMELAAGAFRTASAVLDGASTTLPLDLPTFRIAAGVALSASVPAAVALAAVSTFVVVVAHSTSRR